jgi:hypothetical protein
MGKYRASLSHAIARLLTRFLNVPNQCVHILVSAGI